VTSVITCTLCPRLREYCATVGREKKKAFAGDTYWAKPVPGYGDPAARIVIIGLAPAAHGANRTGRMFTGDGHTGSSGFLARALHENGLAKLPVSERADDGQELADVWITAVCRCAPPDNKPLPEEIARCHTHLRADIDALPQSRVYIALGQIAFRSCWRLVAEAGLPVPKAKDRPFRHGAVYEILGGPTIIASYHPSRQNTQTGKLTSEMLAKVFATAKRHTRRR
jgi:uracil-DNA glycosylase family 4